MSHTHKLKLPFMHSSQAQKEITHNEALNLLDVLVQTVVQNIEQNEPPKAAELGELYIIGSTPKGEFSGHEHEIAQKQEQGWRFIPPFKWMSAILDADGSSYTFNGKIWQPASLMQPLVQPTKQLVSAPAAQVPNDYLIKGENGEYLKVINLQEELEPKGAFTDTKIKIPHHSIVLAVNIRVIKPLQGATAFSVGTDEEKGRYGSGLSASQDTTNVGLTNHPMTYWYDKSIRITADNGSFTGGLISVTVQLLKPRGPWNWE
jgi:hypothetical protein